MNARRTSIPLQLRRIRAQAALKDLRLSDLSAITGCGISAISAALNGRQAAPATVAKIRAAIASTPMPTFHHYHKPTIPK